MDKINFKSFMEDVKSNIEKMDKTELTDFIYELARVTKESSRKDFLEKFDTCKTSDRHADIEKIHKFCEDVNDINVYFYCTAYEDYGSGYWDRDWIYEYSDPQCVGKTLEEAFLLAESLVYEKSYLKAHKLYDLLFSLRISVYYEDAEDMLEDGLGIEEAVDKNLAGIDLTNICNNALYAAYQLTTKEERIESIYQLFQKNEFRNTRLEGMFSVGPEPLSEIEGFMTGFNRFLMYKTGDLESRLLKETIPYIKKEPLEIAREAASVHPGIYYELCLEASNDGETENVILIGSDALKNIPKKYVMRSKVAYLTANAFEKKSDMKGYIYCLLEGFASDSSPINFLNLFTECSRKEIDKAYQRSNDVPVKTSTFYDYRLKELSENNTSDLDRSIIRFLYGDFEYAKAKCKADKKYLGWSRSFKGVCIPLFLLLLENGHADSKAKNKIIEFIKNRVETNSRSHLKLSFEEIILEWKNKILFNDEKDEYLEWMIKEVDKRVEAVVGGGFRKSYYKGAELIVYLGQVLESNGEKGEGQRLIEKYRKIYSRKRAFRADLNDLL